MQNHHDGIIERKIFDAAHAELARRNAIKAPTQKAAPTGSGKYSSKYALTERLICGECGTPYRRCTWNQKGQRRIVWCCINRLGYGKKYCHSSPTLDEDALQAAILCAINANIGDKGAIIQQLSGAVERKMLLFPGSSVTISDIEQQLADLGNEFRRLTQLAGDTNGVNTYGEQFRAITVETSTLKEQKKPYRQN